MSANFLKNFNQPLIALIEKVISDFFPFLLLYKSGVDFTFSIASEIPDKLISPVLKQGQPLSHISLTHKEEINCSQRTFYNYINWARNPRLSYGTYISWLWAVHSRSSGLFYCRIGRCGGGWRQKLPCPPYSFLSQLFLYIPYSHKERIQSFYSTARASLNGCTPFELALLLCDSYFVYYTIMVFFWKQVNCKLAEWKQPST